MFSRNAQLVRVPAMCKVTACSLCYCFVDMPFTFLRVLENRTDLDTLDSIFNIFDRRICCSKGLNGFVQPKGNKEFL